MRFTRFTRLGLACILFYATSIFAAGISPRIEERLFDRKALESLRAKILEISQKSGAPTASSLPMKRSTQDEWLEFRKQLKQVLASTAIDYRVALLSFPSHAAERREIATALGHPLFTQLTLEFAAHLTAEAASGDVKTSALLGHCKLLSKALMLIPLTVPAEALSQDPGLIVIRLEPLRPGLWLPENLMPSLVGLIDDPTFPCAAELAKEMVQPSFGLQFGMALKDGPYGKARKESIKVLRNWSAQWEGLQ